MNGQHTKTSYRGRGSRCDEVCFPVNHSLSNLGRRPSCEVELKLAAPVAELEKLERALLALPTARLEAQSDLVSTYYDTCTLALHRRRLTLRVRRQGGEFVHTIKADEVQFPIRAREFPVRQK